MSSGRGPGVIGMVMALFVLIGFGFLFMFAFDEEMQGADQSIESVIAHQAKEIHETKGAIAHAEETLAGTPKLMAIKKELFAVSRVNQYRDGQIDSLKQGITGANAAVDELAAELEAYKNEYRAFARYRAKGRKLDRLETSTGKVYKNVSIREVTAIGMQIRHDGGFRRIPFEELPNDIQDEFQFDFDQKAAAMDQEQARRLAHETAVSAAERLMDENKQLNADSKRDETIRAIAAKESRIDSLLQEMRTLEIAIAREKRKKISRAPQLRETLAARKQLLASLQADIVRLRNQL